MTDEPLWRRMIAAYRKAVATYDDASIWTGDQDNLVRRGYAAELRVVADEIERRGEKMLDLDPGETADWLRAEADRAEQEVA